MIATKPLTLSLLALAAGLARGHALTESGPPSVTVLVDRARPAGVSRLAMGVTHTHYSLDPGGDAAAIARGKALVRSVARYQNQHIMGWGAMNPNPAPAVYDWASLDQRVASCARWGARR